MNIREEAIESDCFYHIFNRGVNGQKVFANNQNFEFFLIKAKLYLLDYFDVYAYCLMNNHFHFLLRAKPLQHHATKKSTKTGLHSDDQIYSKQIGKLISSYTQAFNKVENRHGPLLESPFKRKKIESETYLRNCLIYIHQNPLELGLKLEDYQYSSYRAIAGNKGTAIKKDEVIDYFDTVENFVFCHKKIVELDDF